jgi:acetylornithine deacetylase/succinyl-diaminopimelate desuccinylase-like protein
MPSSAPNRLVRALSRLVNAPVQLTILPVVQQFFTDITPLAPAELQPLYADLNAASKNPQSVDKLMEDMQKSAMLRNTVSLTVLKSGYKTNVIPAEASAEIDCRLLPDVKPDEFIKDIRKTLADPSIEVSTLEWESAIPSSANTELFQAIKSVADQESPKVPVVPVVVGWFTDSHWFRELGITSYGFTPMEIDSEHLASVHGKNERVPLTVLSNGVRRMHKLLLTVGGAQ